MKKVQKSDSINVQLRFDIRFTMRSKVTLLAVATAMGMATAVVAPPFHRESG